MPDGAGICHKEPPGRPNGRGKSNLEAIAVEKMGLLGFPVSSCNQLDNHALFDDSLLRDE